MPATNLLLHHTKLAIMPQVQSVIPIQQIIATNASTVIERLQNSTFQHSPSLPLKPSFHILGSIEEKLF
jgi:hypothetical protein